MPTSRGSRDRVLLVLAVGALLLVAGCTGAVRTESAATASAAAPTEPSTTSPTRAPDGAPGADQPPGVDGAVAVATSVVELYPYVLATGDDAQWRDLSAPGCVFCQQVIADAESLVAAGHRREGGEVQVGFSVGASTGEEGGYQVDLTMEEAGSRVVDAAGAAVSEWGAAQSYRATVVLLHDGESWSVTGVDRTPVSR